MRAAGVGKDFKENPNLRDNWTDAEGYYSKDRPLPVIRPLARLESLLDSSCASVSALDFCSFQGSTSGRRWTSATTFMATRVRACSAT